MEQDADSLAKIDLSSSDCTNENGVYLRALLMDELKNHDLPKESTISVYVGPRPVTKPYVSQPNVRGRLNIFAAEGTALILRIKTCPPHHWFSWLLDREERSRIPMTTADNF